jgi:hypothetical protein
VIDPRARRPVRLALRAIALAACGLLLAPGVQAAPSTQAPRLDEQCQQFGEEMVPLILRTVPWNLDELTRRASAELLRATPPDLMEAIFRPFNNFLGTLVQAGEPQIEVTIRRRGGDVTTICQYQAPGTFENYNAAIVLQAVLRDGRWQILSLRLNLGGPVESPQPSTT